MKKSLFLSIVILNIMGQIAIEIYVPLLPQIRSYFGTNIQNTQYTIVFFMIGYSFAGLFWGYASDFYGRKLIVTISNVIGIIGTLGCTVSWSIEMLIISRLVQGIGLSGITLIGKAILRDMFKGKDFVKYSSYVAILSGFAIDFSPFLGSVLDSVFKTWRVTFAIVFALNILSYFCGKVLLDEVNLRDMKNFGLLDLGRQLMMGLRNIEFMRFNIISGATFSLFMIYLSVGSYYFHLVQGYTAMQFGLITLFFTLFFMLGNYLNVRLNKRYSSYSLINLGSGLLLFSGLLYIVNYGYANFAIYIFATILMYLATGFIFSNAGARAFTSVDKSIGLLSSFYTVLQIGLAFLGIWLISFFSPTNTLVLGLLFILLGLVMVMLNSDKFIFIVKRILHK